MGSIGIVFVQVIFVARMLVMNDTLGSMYATDIRQTDRRQTASSLNVPACIKFDKNLFTSFSRFQVQDSPGPILTLNGSKDAH